VDNELGGLGPRFAEHFPVFLHVPEDLGSHAVVAASVGAVEARDRPGVEGVDFQVFFDVGGSLQADDGREVTLGEVRVKLGGDQDELVPLLPEPTDTLGGKIVQGNLNVEALQNEVAQQHLRLHATLGQDDDHLDRVIGVDFDVDSLLHDETVQLLGAVAVEDEAKVTTAAVRHNPPHVGDDAFDPHGPVELLSDLVVGRDDLPHVFGGSSGLKKVRAGHLVVGEGPVVVHDAVEALVHGRQVQDVFERQVEEDLLDDFGRETVEKVLLVLLLGLPDFLLPTKVSVAVAASHGVEDYELKDPGNFWASASPMASFVLFTS